MGAEPVGEIAGGWSGNGTLVAGESSRGLTGSTSELLVLCRMHVFPPAALLSRRGEIGSWSTGKGREEGEEGGSEVAVARWRPGAHATFGVR